jgi:hypothetical protein
VLTQQAIEHISLTEIRCNAKLLFAKTLEVVQISLEGLIASLEDV